MFLGRSVTQHKTVAEETARLIDTEVRRILDDAYAKATRILTDNADKLKAMAEALIKCETIDAKQIDAIMEGREPGPPSDWWDHPSDSGPGSGPTLADEKEAGKSKIGGPAEQH